MENINNSNKLVISKEIAIKKNALFIWLCSGAIIAVIRFMLNFIGIDKNVYREMIFWIVTSFPYIYLLVRIGPKRLTLSKSSFYFIFIFILVIISFFKSLLFNPEISEFYFRENYGIGRVFRPDGAIYAFLLFSMFDNPSDIYDTLLKSAFVILVYQIVVVLFPVLIRGYWIDISPTGNEIHLRYSLSFGYEMGYLFMIFFIAALREKKITYYFLTLICLGLNLFYGGRGSLIILLIFIFVLIVFGPLKNNESKYKKTIIICFIVLGGAILFFNYEEILYKLSELLNKYNIDSRNIDKLINGSFSEANGRDIIWNVVVEAIKNGGIFGYGFFGDRPFVAPYHIAGYSHNIFLELLVSFGLIGAFFIVYIMIDTIKMLFLCKDKEWKLIYIILFSSSCKLLLSFTFWYVWQFWAAAGIAYKYKIISKKENNSLY